MRSLLKLGFYLLVLGAVAGIAVAFVNSSTAPIIAASAVEAKLEGLQEVYPNADTVEDAGKEYIDGSSPSEITDINIAYIDSQPVGVIYTVEPRGYSGLVSTMVGFDIDKKEITRIKIISQTETPGLGAQCVEPWFAEMFRGKNAVYPLEVTKQQPAGDNEIVAITASTVTSKAVTNGVNIAREHFLEHFAQD